MNKYNEYESIYEDDRILFLNVFFRCHLRKERQKKRDCSAK